MQGIQQILRITAHNYKTSVTDYQTSELIVFIFVLHPCDNWCVF